MSRRSPEAGAELYAFRTESAHTRATQSTAPPHRATLGVGIEMARRKKIIV